MNKNLEMALKYSKLNWCVIPVRADKKPLIRWKDYQTKRSTENEIREWFTVWEDANVGILTGSMSNIVVVDVDSKSGFEYLSTVVDKKDLDTLKSRTGGGGVHLFYRTKKNLSNAVGILPGVDFRAEGGYVVVPPSQHITGKHYQWLNNNKIINLPESIETLFNSKKPGITEVDWELNVKEGERNNELARRTGKLIRAKMPKSETLKFLIEWNQNHCKPPLPEKDVEIIVESIYSRSQSQEIIINENKKAVPVSDNGFNVLTFEQMQKKYSDAETSWIIQDWLPNSTIGMLVAAPGQFKTWLLLDLATSISTGKDFLNRYPVLQTGSVLIIQQEDPFDMLLYRINSIMNVGEIKEINGNEVVPLLPNISKIYWHPDRQLNFKNKDSLLGLEHVIQKYNIRMVLIDPLYSAADSKDYMAEDAHAMLFLKKIRDNNNCSFMIAHHTVKRKDLDGRENLWGSQFLNAWLETGWQIRILKDNPSGVTIRRHFKGTVAPNPIEVVFNIGPHHYSTKVIDSDSKNKNEEAISYLRLCQ